MSAALTGQVELGNEAPTALYRLFDADGSLLYIGITDSLKARFAQHAASKPWWLEVAKRTAEWHPSREAALAAETDAIRTERPRYNVAHAAEPLLRRAAADQLSAGDHSWKRLMAGFVNTLMHATPSDLRQWHEQMITAEVSRLSDLLLVRSTPERPAPFDEAIEAGLNKAKWSAA